MTDFQFCFQPEAEHQLYEWMFHRKTPAFLLVGPPGIGKTTLVHRIMKKVGYTLCEFNASHTRSGIAFRKTILPLLKHGGVQEWLRDGTPDRMAVLLDEMDGLSGGEKGGLAELLGFLRDWKQGDGSHPLVLICNTLHGRPMEQIRRICTTMILQPPRPDVILQTLHGKHDLPDDVAQCGDLRVIFRHLQGFPALNQHVHIEDSNCTSASLEWAWHCLYNDYDPYLNIALENNEASLAGLVLHENSPARLAEYEDALDVYLRLFNIFYVSDWADFWSFFYQCWQILPLSQQLKLKVTNQIFHEKGAPSVEPPTPDELVFTRVLSRQSALFNAWREMCRIHDIEHVPIRCVPMVAGTFPEQKSRNLCLSLGKHTI
jgi:hypothetical protein